MFVGWLVGGSVGLDQEVYVDLLGWMVGRSVGSLVGLVVMLRKLHPCSFNLVNIGGLALCLVSRNEF